MAHTSDRFEVGRTPNAVTDVWYPVTLNPPHSSPPVILASIETFHGPDSAGVRIDGVGGSSFKVKIEEETSGDAETGHDTEQIAYFAVGRGNIKDALGNLIGEASTVTTNQPDGGTWRTVNLDNNYCDPVVLMQIMTFKGDKPAHTRLRNIGSTSFEFQIEEWDYEDQEHTDETIGYLVMEQRMHQMDDGTIIEVGTVQTDHNWATVSFGPNFSSAPVTLSHCQTRLGGDAVVTREKNVTDKEFEVRLQEQGGKRIYGKKDKPQEQVGKHDFDETIGYIAASV